MGLGLGDFLDLTPFEWTSIKRRFLEYQVKARQERWELRRWQIFKTLCPPKGKGGYITLHDIEVFPWENEAKPEPSTEERFRKAVEMYK